MTDLKRMPKEVDDGPHSANARILFAIQEAESRAAALLARDDLSEAAQRELQEVLGKLADIKRRQGNA